MCVCVSVYSIRGWVGDIGLKTETTVNFTVGWITLPKIPSLILKFFLELIFQST